MEQDREPPREPGYQPRGRAWDPGREDILDLLREAEQSQVFPIYQGSNHTFLSVIDGGVAGESLAVYKPARGEYPLYDFPSGTLYRREIGAWLVDHILGWNVVPPTVERNGPYGLGSLQLFIESPDEIEIDVRDLRRIAVLDAVLNNADRKADHCMPDLQGNLWGIDHGLTFHTQPKMRTVLWHFAGASLTRGEISDLRRLYDALCNSRGWEAPQLQDFISKPEWRALIFRVERLVELGRLPNPRYKPVPYRW
jgi:hypothetical protein